MPLALGNHWTYMEYIADQGDTTWSHTTVLQIVSTVMPHGLRYFTTNTRLVFGQRPDGLSIAWYDDGLHSLSEFEVLLRYPVVPGPGYLYATPHVEGFPPVWIAVSADTVDTGLGPLRRLNYAVGAPLSVQFGFTPGIGLITMQNRFGTRWVLESFSEAGGPHVDITP